MITIKVTVSQKEMIEKMAKERGFNVSQFIFYLLQKELEKKE